MTLKNTTYLVIIYTLAAFALVFALTGCSNHDRAQSCHVEDNKISCPDGSTNVLPEGKAGAAGPKGTKGDQGEQGISGLQGLQGLQGVQGVVGPQGIQGIPGSAGTIVTFVKFCPQVTSYPSTFPEYGLCVAGDLYAVYSANGGFGVKLPEGTYSSQGVGSSCTFTVGALCAVTN